MSMIAKNRIHSQWTPLSNEETNNKIFEERKELVGKWFSKWNDDQRRKLFEELVGLSKKKQLDYARELIDNRVPSHKEDFTRYLPRVITLYIFSYLDASSLCQCAQVCWYWRYLAELDQLWMSKCLHFGWYLTFTPSPYENGVWKRNFIEQFRIIKALLPKPEGEVKDIIRESPPIQERIKPDNKRSEKKKKTGPTPWRGSDPVPKDTWRFNILNNDEVVEQVNKKRERKVYGSATDDVVRNAKSKVNTGNNVLNTLYKSQLTSKSFEIEEKKRISASSSTADPNAHLADRPRWAKQQSMPPTTGGFLHKNAMKQNGILAKVTRPEPVSSPPRVPKSRPATARSARDPPTADLFPQTPWRVPAEDSDDA